MTRSPHILCYAPYTTWSIHSSRQVTILQALRLRGCSVSYITCDAAFSDCDITQQATGATSTRQSNTCLTCQSSVAARLATWNMPYRWLGRWLYPEDEAEAGKWVLDLSAHERPSARYKDWKIGEWVKSSVHTHFRVNSLDMENEEIAATYGSYLFSGLLACKALSRLMDEEKPDAQLLFNGRMSTTRIALELAKQRGIRTICEERCPVVGRIRLFDNANCLSVDDTDALWDSWKDIPLSGEEIEELSAFLEKRWQGRLKDVAVFSQGMQSSSEALSQLGLSPDRPIWVLFTSSMDETIDKPRKEGLFPSHQEWVEATVEYVRNKPEIQLAIRVHPNAGGKRALGRNAQDEEYYANLAQRVPDNVQVIQGDNPVSSYTLAAVADVGLVWYSTIGLEMAAMGKSVVRAGRSWLAYADFMHSALQAQDYASLLDDMRNISAQGPNLESAARAWRFAYVWYYRQSIPFPLVRQPEWYVGEPAYENVEELQPGRDPELDRICDIFMNGKPLYGPAEQRQPTMKASEISEIGKHVAHLTRC